MMRFSVILLAAILLAATLTAASAANAAETATVDDVANSAALCMLSADKNGADRSRFENDAWTFNGQNYQHISAPISIEFPTDGDGVNRVCVVRAILSDQYEQNKVVKILTSILDSKPLKQSESQLWMVSTAAGPRGIQFFTDPNSDQPQVRLIGAAF
ncbi:hypothetical protein P8R33_07305 [Qipengyuania sp. XHP0211]|uniref:hypothetical protein n=1 Tax=Qipengyuania sp. XHP0211 TaxID=3038079 RepID=UPI00241D0AA5|nr:hypothetical protein [Qipengyuania sp. XHP0211]MDG5750906.1 hypothetical protein [Qipengyuania sp. XHP0211]